MRDWQELIRDAQEGDLGAFDALVTRFRDMAVGYAYSVLRDFGQAEDAAQEAFVQAYKDLKTLREPRAFPAWLRRIVFKHCDRLSRRRKPGTEALEAARDVRDHAKNPLEQLQAAEERGAVARMIEELPDHERAPVSLFYINGYSMGEVGQFLEVPAARVKSRLHSARRKLKERMVAMIEATLHQHAPGSKFNERVRRVLAGVPVVSFELHRETRKDALPRCPESTPFPSCLRACLEHAGEDMGYRKIESHGRAWRLDTTYVYLMGMTGAAFRLNWKSGFHMDNPELACMSPDPIAPYRRGVESVGYSLAMIEKTGAGDIEASFRKNIIESIRDRGHPVIARGVVGPPVDCLITGFDEAGDVVIGWSFFQRAREFKGDIQFEPNGYFRKRGWFADTERLTLLGEKIPRPRPESAYRDALAWALRVARDPMTDRHNGFAAYEAWAQAILDDGEFTGRKLSELRYRYHVHQDAVGTIAEGRWYAKNFIEKVLDDVPAPDAFTRAARCYEQEHALMWQLWALVGGPGYSDKRARVFVDADIRKKTAELILQARDEDRRAADFIEGALEQW